MYFGYHFNLQKVINKIWCLPVVYGFSAVVTMDHTDMDWTMSYKLSECKKADFFFTIKGLSLFTTGGGN